jgi:hypothetical protein
LLLIASLSTAELSIGAGRNGDTVYYEVHANSTSKAYVFIFANGTQILAEDFIGSKAGRISVSRYVPVEIRAAIIGGEAKYLELSAQEPPATNNPILPAQQQAAADQQELQSNAVVLGLTIIAIIALIALLWNFTGKTNKKGGRK